MIVVMKNGAQKKDIEKVSDRIKEMGYTPHISEGTNKTIIGVIGDLNKDLNRDEVVQSLGAYPEIERLVPIQEPYKLVGRSFKEEDTIVDVDGVKIGGKKLAIIGGPCSVEGEEQIVSTARAVKKAGGQILRGGAFKPRTSPYSFQGLLEKGLKLLDLASQETGLKIVTEVMDPRDVDLVARYTDILQIGARNMQNYNLLKEVGQAQTPVLLKRGMHATYKEFLMAAEYIMSEGNHDVILCERGIRTFEEYTRNTLDLLSIPITEKLSHLPIIIDPSHGTGDWELVNPAARGAVAMGADGLMIEVHPEPQKALSDGQQSLDFERFSVLMDDLEDFARAAGREL
ncbi:MAG: 3-deoxy-7-phosphoheptulonate synthase [Bacillota bacterium]